MISPLSNAVSGAQTAARRVAVSASNIANVTAVQPTTAAGTSRPESFVPLRVDQVSQQGGGARAEVQIVAQPLVQQAYGRQASQQGQSSSDDPLTEEFEAILAEESGFAEGALFASAVDLEGEFTAMIRAQAAYGANVEVIKTTQEMIGEALDITT